MDKPTWDWESAQRRAYGLHGLTPDQFWSMTPREWCLLEDGAADRIRLQNRRVAYWMAPLLSATAGQAVTAAQLLGEDEPEQTKSSGAATQRAAERQYDAMMRKIAKRQKKGK